MANPTPDTAAADRPRPDTAVLLVNLGTPEAPTAPAVRRYLAQFLSDPYVVQVPRLLWWPLLHGLILPLRSRRVADKYRQVWLEDGSPLAAYTRRLAAQVQARLPGLRVDHAMRYGEPSLPARLAALKAEGVRRVLVLPLYPQYSTTTTETVLVQAREHAAGLALRMRDNYATDAGWVQAIADSIRAHWQANGRGEVLLMSFHGIPQRLVDGGDPYERQCRASAAAIAQALGIGEDAFRITFQSRFGRERWLLPATDATVQALAGEGVRTLDVVCPGFAVDCLETLEEIAMENAKLFAEHGGQSLRYIRCLNDSAAHAQALSTLIEGECVAWV